MSVDSTATLTSFKEANVYFKFTRFLISCTGLHLLPLDRSVSPFFLAFRGTRALLAVLIIGAYIVNGLLSVVLQGEKTWKRLAALWVVLGRTWVSTLFLLYWQFNGDLKHIYGLLSDCPRLCAIGSTVKLRRIDIGVSLVVVAHALVQFTICWWSITSILLGDMCAEDLLFPDPFKMEYGFIFWSNLVAYQTCAGTAVLALQVVVVLSMQHLFKQQNARIIGITCPVAGAAPAGRSGGCSTRIANILEEEMKNHLALSEALVTTNKVLELHTLARFALLIPRIVTTTWYFQQPSWGILNDVASVSEICMTLLELVALLVIPANVHATIQQAELALWKNERIWLPYDEKLNQLARTFLARVKQNNLGVSLGGFTIITKSLFLTLVSMTITFLTVFNEMRKTPFTPDFFAELNFTQSSD
ncbi:GUR-5 protein [Aphelenchoides avenae]|nr:GUR-5 protein [Aphelenchus avenae]